MILALALTLGAAPAHADPVPCVVPLGDSITHSGSGYFSWRYHFWSALDAEGYTVDMVGSTTTDWYGRDFNYPNPDMDPDHDGHSGWRADQIADYLPTWTLDYTPDLAIIHLGTNDIFQGESIGSTVDDLEDVVAALRDVNPEVTVLLSQIIPIRGAFYTFRVNRLNEAIAELAELLDSAESPVVVVDQNTGFSVNAETFDGVHPNHRGDQKMGAVYYEAALDHWPTSTHCED